MRTLIFFGLFIGGVILAAFGLEDVERGAAVHAAPTLGEEDIKNSGRAVVERFDAEGFFVFMCEIVEEWRAFTEWAGGLATVEIGDCPDECADGYESD